MGQEVNGSSAFAPTCLSSLKSMPYAAVLAATSTLFLRTIRTISMVLLGSSKSFPTKKLSWRVISTKQAELSGVMSWINLRNGERSSTLLSARG